VQAAHLRCAGCRQVAYCSAACQRAHRAQHKRRCAGRKAVAAALDSSSGEVGTSTGDGRSRSVNVAADDTLAAEAEKQDARVLLCRGVLLRLLPASACGVVCARRRSVTKHVTR
jgi:hypothetical protein